MRFRIRHLSGSKAGQEELLEGNVITVGRDPASALKFDPHVDDRVSTNHAQILVQDNGQVMLTDLGSSNGTYVGGQKLSAPVAIGTGAMITFGDGGPQIALIFEPPEVAAPASEPPKKSKKGLILGMVVGGLLLLGCVITGVVMLSGDDSEGTPDGEVAPDGEATPDDGEGAAPGASTEDPKAGDDQQSPWAKLGVGTTFELKTNTEMEIAGMPDPYKSESTLKYTLKSKDETHATVLMETITAGTTTPMEQKIPLKVKVAKGEEPEVLEEKDTEVEVAAGKFDCRYTKTKMTVAGKEHTVETWMDPDLPVPYKSVTTSETSKTVMELVSMDKK